MSKKCVKCHSEEVNIEFDELVTMIPVYETKKSIKITFRCNECDHQYFGTAYITYDFLIDNENL